MAYRILSGIALVVVVAIVMSMNPQDAVHVGQHAPHFRLPQLDGQDLVLEDLHGKVVLLNFWATSCGPCAYEMPALNALYKQYGDQGLQVIGINEDGSMDYARPLIEEFQERIPIHFPIVIDGTGEVANQFGTFRIPETFLIDRQGTIVHKHVGIVASDDPKMHSMIRQTLRQ